LAGDGDSVDDFFYQLIYADYTLGTLDPNYLPSGYGLWFLNKRRVAEHVLHDENY
jgi:hypothetical protein